jgi:hypothetical protein
MMASTEQQEKCNIKAYSEMNCEGRFDYVLQESGLEAYVKTVGLL